MKKDLRVYRYHFTVSTSTAILCYEIIISLFVVFESLGEQLYEKRVHTSENNVTIDYISLDKNPVEA